MKFYRHIGIFLFIVLGLCSCKKDTDVNMDSFKIVKEREKVIPGTTTVNIFGVYEYLGRIDAIAVELGTNSQLFHSDLHPTEIKGDAFNVDIDGLTPGTHYYYRYVVDYGHIEPFQTEIDSFWTLTEVPTVKALGLQRIDSITYRINCQVETDGGSEVIERGICWNTYGFPVAYDDSTRRYNGNVGMFEEYYVRMEHLALGEKYYVRAYAKNTEGKIGYSKEPLDFETEAPVGMTVDIEVSSNPEEGGSVDGGGSYEVGTQCIVKAMPNTGYTFVGWTENGSQVWSESEYPFIVTTARHLVANFTKRAYVITAEVTPENSGTVSGTGGYNYGEECVLTATPNTGYDFVKWTKDGTLVTIEPECRFTVTESANYVAYFKIKSYTITVLANPSNGGSVSEGGTYNHGQSCTVHAIPAEGFAFANWMDDGEVVSENAEYTFTVTSNRTLVANYTELQPDEYSIQVSANPTEGGTVTGGGTYTQGTSCTVTATPIPGFTFVNWTENGSQVHDLREFTFTVDRNRNLVANFEAEAPSEYTVSVSANPSEGGTVTGGGTYQQGQQCTVTATVNEGYTFINWTEDGEEVSTNPNNYTFIVNSNRNMVANFAIKSYTISASSDPNIGGTVSGGGTYNYGESCTVIATSNGDYVFTNWTENGNVVSTNANYTFTVNGDRTLVAHFKVQAPNTYYINASSNPSAGGEVTGSGTYEQGAFCTVTATANSGYTFTNWKEGNTVVSDSTRYTFSVTGDRTLKANFTQLHYTISLSANPTAGGTVSGGGTNFTYNQSCTVTATPATGYRFVRWTENDGTEVSTNASYQFTVTGNRTLVAQFQADTYTISVSANPTAGGTVSGGGTNFTYNQSCTVTATPATGYHFVRWTENGTQVSTNASYQFTVTGNRTLVAQFQADTYTISVSANPTAGGTVSGGGTYNYGTTITLTATANANYTFDHWQDNTTTNPRTITVTGDAIYTAFFTAQSQAPTGAINGKFTINSNGDKVYFSQGNLQYIGSASTPYWKFADTQWSVIVSNQENNLQSTNRDLFGWGTSGWNSGNTYYYPWDTNNSNGSLYGTLGQYNMTGSYANVDWGVYNTIFSNTIATVGWRTLTQEEWNYVFNNTQRGAPLGNVDHARYAKARVSNVQGMILFPDDYTHPSGVTLPQGINATDDTGWNGNSYSEGDFVLMQAVGAVFLPAAGYRFGASVYDVDSNGNYWSSSCFNSDGAYSVNFNDSYLSTGDDNIRYYGFSVRLVRSAQ